MTTQTPAPAETFLGLRNLLFRGELGALAPSPGQSNPGDVPEILGVAMEGGLDAGSYLVYGLRDGSASLYLSSGGGSIGGQGRPHINACAKSLVKAAQPFLDKLPLVGEFPIPSVGRVRFSIFTSDGVRAGEANESEVTSTRNEFFPLFVAAQEIISGFRMAERGEHPDAPTYLNCLLTVLARGTVPSVTILEGAPLPDPTQLTTDVLDLEWIAESGFQLDKLSQAQVIEALTDLAGFRWFHFWNPEKRIKVKLAAHGGNSFRNVTFSVRRSREGARNRVEVAVLRSR